MDVWVGGLKRAMVAWLGHSRILILVLVLKSRVNCIQHMTLLCLLYYLFLAFYPYLNRTVQKAKQVPRARTQTHCPKHNRTVRQGTAKVLISCQAGEHKNAHNFTMRSPNAFNLVDGLLNINGIFDFPWNRFSELNASAAHLSSELFFPYCRICFPSFPPLTLPYRYHCAT